LEILITDHLRTELGTFFADILSIEYQSARIYANSLGLQAVVERIQAENNSQSTREDHSGIAIDSTDYSFIQEVVDGSLDILRTAIKMAESRALTYSPVRIFLRITTASVFLIKGLGLGVGATKLRSSLDILNRCIAALRSSSSDDMHLSTRYAMLLEMYVVRLHNSFIPSTRPPSVDRGMTGGLAGNGGTTQGTMGFGSANMEDEALNQIEDWLTLPFDPSLVPFMPDDMQGFSSLVDGSLDFLWNLEA
jgi:hypothetical protein